MRPKIAVLLSGGVDSSVAALFAVKRYGKNSVVAWTLKLTPHNDIDVERAKEVARHLGITHRVLDLEKSFGKKVVKYFVNSYGKGLTPNPCAVCNARVKLGEAVDILLSEGFEKIFTGHYVRKGLLETFPVLKRAKDTKKDQSYFLALLRPENLKPLEFPLGELTKDEVRKIALEAALPTASRKESQDICFLEGQKVGDFLKKYFPPSAGEFIYRGKVVGRHEGFFRYTVSQRRGLGLRLGRPVYVTKIDASQNRVFVGEKEELKTDRVLLKDLNPFVEERFWRNLYGQIRYRTPPERVKRFEKKTEGVLLEFERPFFGVAPGQIGALYVDNEILVAGGIIG
jgi:tRNA-specific 2-thiouridylase